jgi:hypothetical protein
MLMSNLDSITSLSLDPELLDRFLQKLPVEVIEQLAHNWREQPESSARSEEENRVLEGLLRLMRGEKHRPTITAPMIERRN